MFVEGNQIKMNNSEKTIQEFIDSARWSGTKGPENFAYLVERLTGNPAIKQLQFDNGAYVSSILEFMEDNPGLVDAMVEWIVDNYEEEIEADGNLEEDHEEG